LEDDVRKTNFAIFGALFLCPSLSVHAQAASNSSAQLVTIPPISARTSKASTLASPLTVPTDTLPKSVAFGQQVRVWTVWYLNLSNCTSIATGTITASEGPLYGTVTSVVGNATLPPGYACAGDSLPATKAYYTWNVSNPTAVVDFFHLHYLASNGVTDDTDWQALLAGGGDAGNYPGACATCDPIDLGSGNVFEQVTDYTTFGQNPISFVRYYNSLGVPNTFSSELGVNWRSNYDRFLSFVSSSLTVAERPDGRLLNFTLAGGVWTPDTDVDYTLTQEGSTWTLTDSNDTVETYTTPVQLTGFIGVALDSIKIRNGYTQTLQYSTSVQLQSVTDSYGRQLTFTYNGGALLTVSTPDGLVMTYGYNTIVGGVNNQLASVTYSTSPSTSQQYLYSNSALPFAVTNIIDEDGNTYATFSYDQFGRGVSSLLGTSADSTAVSYDDTDTTRTVTNGLGQPEVYSFTVLQTLPKAVSIQRQATGTTSAATRTFSYDTNGYLASATDWNGNETTYVNNTLGEPTTITEAVGTPVQRTTTIVYDPIFVHLPDSITTPGLTTTFTYDSSGDVLTKTLTDTTTQTVPYSTNGETRKWTYAWSNFLLASVKTPVGNLTQYGYDSTGALTGVTNALNQKTQITQHTPGGLPLTIIDPNDVTTNLTYDGRQRLLSSAITTSKGVLTTSFSYDAAGNLTSVTLPDNSKLTNGYDTAHRLISVTDLFSNAIAYTLDSLGDAMLTKVTNSGNSVTRTHSGIFDALARVLQDIGGAGQDTQYSYDNDGNALTVTDPDNNLTTRTFDALNRLSTVTDPSPGGTTTTTYDAHDRPLTVTDPNGNVTSYTYDGFGDVIQQASADSGTTVYYYDADANLTRKIDATRATTNMTYDALDRVLTTAYPADAKENAKYTYDQSGHGFGIGRLTSLKDAAGDLSRSYDERGNVLSEKRVIGATTLQTAYAYDAASRVASITYPDSAVVTYTRDAMGRITRTSARAPGSGTLATVAFNIAYEPFGPSLGLTYANQVKEQRTYDLDYRLLGLTDTGRAAVQNLTYGYDPANNVLSITDMVNSGNSQAFTYDPLNRLITASGSYGPLSWTYDPVGNRLTQIQGSTLTQYTYGPGNRLASTTSGGVTQTVGYTAAGNISSFNPAFGPVTSLTYNQANRLSVANGGNMLLGSYTYDAFGHRLQKATTGPTTLYQYDLSGNLLEETNAISGAQADYIYLNGCPVATITPSTGVLSFLHDDRLCTPQLATGSSQSTVWSVGGYQPFGQTGTVTGSLTQNLRLPGQYFDEETGWNHNGFRDYIPNLGRYLESDPIGLAGGMNTYLYASANPLKFTDTWGLLNLNLLAQGTELQRTESLYNPQGVYSVAAHGYPQLIEDETTGTFYTPQQFANFLYQHGYVRGSGQTVVLHSCSTGAGANSFAQQLATILGAPVIAPNDIIQGLVVLNNGELTETALTENGGQFYLFTPHFAPLPLGQSTLDLTLGQ
jgi:RHS repeat-associated protein